MTSLLAGNRFIAFGLAPVDSQGNLWGCERAPLIEGEFCLSNSGAGGFFEGDVMGFGVDVHTQTKFVTRNGMVTNAGAYFYLQPLPVPRFYQLWA